jgi:hypothetical protein
MKTDKFFQNKKILEKALIDNNLEPEYTSEDYGWDEGNYLSFMYPGDHDAVVHLYFDGSIGVGGSEYEHYLFGINTDIVISFIKARRKRK